MAYHTHLLPNWADGYLFIYLFLVICFPKAETSIPKTGTTGIWSFEYIMIGLIHLPPWMSSQFDGVQAETLDRGGSDPYSLPGCF